ncbi:TetR family transcriptional regulator [Lentzea aerocolonigenes]|uniref:TetR family transcriptional regulator n=1 Tax=Lentzea aerocolonigenes TaxID=68170 RepID=A0A0F0GKC6_LENAE|nr:TetR family transcriptional regulator [Lentzea aerocolonigenes]KJK41264.1 TetR family transcriptional regulator [Lentzea aerocolonigenes]
MRADAARNLELVLTTGARMLAADPAASIAAIAAEAGVDRRTVYRRTVYRRFASREELLAAVYQARLDAIEEAISAARLREAPVEIALHRYVEGIIGVNRKWPVELSRMTADTEAWARRNRAVDEVEVFIQRCVDQGFLRAGQPAGWMGAVLGHLLHLGGQQLLEHSPAQAADVLVDTFLNGCA